MATFAALLDEPDIRLLAPTDSIGELTALLHRAYAGLGRRLMARAERWAREHGFHELALDTAEPATHLVAFHARLGHREVGHVQWEGKVYRSVVTSKPLG